MSEDLSVIKDEILLATLDQVPFDGFSKRALTAGVAVAGYDASMVLRAFPNGVGDVAEHFSDWANRQMIIEVNKLDLASMGVREKIHACIKARLMLCAPYKEAVIRLSSWLAMPQNTEKLTRMTWEISSQVWYTIGDTSSDWNYYSKRTLLAAAYSATVLYWMADEADDDGDYPNTWEFLDRRLNGITQTFGAGKKLGEMAASFLGGVKDCYGRMGGIGKRT